MDVVGVIVVNSTQQETKWRVVRVYSERDVVGRGMMDTEYKLHATIMLVAIALGGRGK